MRPTSWCQLYSASSCSRQPVTIRLRPLGSTVTISQTRTTQMHTHVSSGVRFLSEGAGFHSNLTLPPHCYCILRIGKSVCNGSEGGKERGKSTHVVWNVLSCALLASEPCSRQFQLLQVQDWGLHLVVCGFFMALFERWFFPPQATLFHGSIFSGQKQRFVRIT